MQTDPLSNLFTRFNLQAGVFHNGNLCGIVDFGIDGDTGGHLHLLRAGRLRVHLKEGKTMQVHAPSLLCFARSSEHRFEVTEEDKAELTCASLHFQGGSNNPIAQAMPELLVLSVDELVHARPLLNWLFAEAFEPAEGRVAVLNRLCELLVIQILRHLIQQGKTDSGLLAGLADPRLVLTLEALHAEPAAAWTIDSMAQEAGMSRARFAAHFRAIIGFTPLDYLTRWRLMLAQQQLLAGQAIKLVANAVGYESASALTRVFRQRLGSSPASWLSQQRKDAARF
ncbi:AraC-like DNA-binding protein [Herbaspirillum sp. Sphag1AN]|uniref:AraC family transcriptional regulator n=1 Tax=unclassified Herbaspirillum TaxID=2624150 RepID=UPI00160C920D|nr:MULTISPECIES: AraC family transcriptional regulator [unclassified Herbaspirillum]MBB3213877.1 AraC-like DNA-binding protein [Herbaspirillum sp. Sphag1AN]MBB3247074.1 AraC-like DNA-binding protein [Herbaspirillum sp. Sphag64]